MKTKNPIAWYENNLKNSIKYCESKIEELKRLQSLIERMEKEHAFLQLQIDTAKSRKMDGFNQDRFLKNKLTGK